MDRFFTIFIATIIGVLLGSVVLNHSVTAVIKANVPNTVEEWIEYYAEEYQVDATELKRVAYCESGYRVAISGDSGKAFGVFQFHEPTFTAWSKEMGESLDYKNFQHQIKVASWAFSQGKSYKKHWTCWTKLYN